MHFHILAPQFSIMSGHKCSKTEIKTKISNKKFPRKGKLNSISLMNKEPEMSVLVKR